MMKIKKEKLIPTVMIAVMFILGHVGIANAAEIVNVSAETRGDFVLSPAKVEVLLSPGESTERVLTITNRTGEKREFSIGIEDFVGSKNPSKTVVLLGDERGPYSLKDYIKPELNKFILEAGEQIKLPINIAVPEGAEPGGLYGSVLVSSTSSVKGSLAGGPSGAVIVSRIGSLFFVGVSGEADVGGGLEDFRISGGKNVFFKETNMQFEMLFRNSGNIHLNPYGMITITNIGGVDVDKIEIEPYFSIPNSLRSRVVSWDRELMFGRYKATLELNRGYEDIVDESSVVFWVIPWKIILAVFAALLLLMLVVRWIGSRFEFKRKEQNNF